VWHIFVLSAACLFFFDIFLRRVSIHLDWAPPLAVTLKNRVLRRTAAPAAPEFVARLRSRKEAVAADIEQRRAAVRFSPQEAPPAPANPEIHPAAPVDLPVARPLAAPLPSAAAPASEESYTSRLLKAKKQVWEQDNSKKREDV